MLPAAPPAGVLVDPHVAYNTPDALPRRRLEVVGTRGPAVAVDTMGQTAGGRSPCIDADRRRVDVPFDTRAGPFAASSPPSPPPSRGDGRPGPTPLERDLRLHRLLLESLP